MQSSNPVFRRADGFNGRSSADAYGNQTYAGNGISYPAYGTPTGTDPYADPYARQSVDQRRMTIDSVVQRTAITIGVTVVVAALTWIFTGNATELTAQGDQTRSTLYFLSMIGAFGGFALSMVN